MKKLLTLGILVAGVTLFAGCMNKTVTTEEVPAVIVEEVEVPAVIVEEVEVTPAVDAVVETPETPEAPETPTAE